ncbi:hypothetical protein BOX15_Mlig011383g1 [Macrostomum lignano]|uniref:Uncharacterized protein n=1 Tax=Macrostomum lignano TaxID=282301 RepID=A0A267EGC5_9PLAT|nr:hypothetical protein BOX15_Mlig011383g1 [Macrostomum lignano]
MVHQAVQITLVALTTIMLLLTLLFNYFSTSEVGYRLGLFSINSATPWTQRANLTKSNLTPPGWAFTIWAVIYVYQAVMLAYCWSLLFIKNAAGEPLCCVPGLLPVGFLICHMISSGFNIAWIFVTDKVEYNKYNLIPQTIMLFLLAISLWACLIFSFNRLSVHKIELRQQGLRLHYWLVIGLLQNSCGFYVGWTCIASFLNLDIAIVNITGYTAATSSLLALCQFCGLLGAYITADFSFLDPFLRFFIAPYLTLIWALATSVAGNYAAGSVTSDLTVELTAALIAALIVKVVLAIVRQKRDPLPDSTSCSRIMDSKEAATPN